MSSVLEQFLEEEASPYVRKLIADAVSQHLFQPGEVQKRFEFNRFEVILDFMNDSVLIEDVLDPATSGEVRLKLDEFLRYLASGNATR
jgi:hypothetical protein